MNDIVKLRELIENGYLVTDVKVDSSGQGVISLAFSGIGNPVDGQIYFLITEDNLVIERAKEHVQ